MNYTTLYFGGSSNKPSTGRTLSAREVRAMVNGTSKYMNARGQFNLAGINLFRGEAADGRGGGLGRGSLGEGLYVTPSLPDAEYYASRISGGRVSVYTVKKGANIVYGDKALGLEFDDYVMKTGLPPEKAIRSYALSKGIDGISGRSSDPEFVIFNTNVIKKKRVR